MAHDGEWEEEDEYFVPLTDQSVFGAGIKRKRVHFVSSTSLSATTSAAPPPSKSDKNNDVADTYLSIVLKHHNDHLPSSSEDAHPQSKISTTTPQGRAGDEICSICQLPLSSSGDNTNTARAEIKPHESSLAHQVCLKHSHPPSHLDRERPGLKYLSSYGWDPDARVGLGAEGREGIRAPIKGVMKKDTVGLGVINKKKAIVENKEVKKLDAKQIRTKELEARKKGERLRQMFYGKEDVEKYLGEGG